MTKSYQISKGNIEKMSLEDLLIRVSGSDVKILNECPDSEKTKHSMFGALIMIPAILAVITMSYALSTMVDNPLIFISGGIIWGLIILIIDRFIVSTFRVIKCDFNNGNLSFNSKWDKSKIIGLIGRFALAATIGVFAGHPFILWMFRDVIDDKLITMRVEVTNRLRNSISAPLVTLDADIQRLEKSVEKARGIYNAELNGESRKDGQSTGKAGFGKMAKKAMGELDALEAQLSALRRQREESNSVIQSNTKEKIARADSIKTGYAMRDRALSLLEVELGAEIWGKRYFVIFCFILIDTLVVILKYTAKAGPYDSKIAERDCSIMICSNGNKTYKNDGIDPESEKKYLESKIQAWNYNKLEYINKFYIMQQYIELLNKFGVDAKEVSKIKYKFEEEIGNSVDAKDI
jgi:hypothetical protein